MYKRQVLVLPQSVYCSSVEFTAKWLTVYTISLRAVIIERFFLDFLLSLEETNEDKEEKEEMFPKSGN